VSDDKDSAMSVHLPWHDQQWQHLDKLLRENKLPHALLLSGSPGVGKQRFAMAFARYVMCENPGLSMACGECGQCLLNNAGTHPDLKMISPEEKAKQIKVDQVRELVAYLGHTAQQGGYKIVLMTPAESMNINASNALLKSLEEPAANTLLILISNASEQLIATIRSRCQLIHFPLPSKQQAINWLTPLMPSDMSVEAHWQEAGGQPLTALALHQSNGLERHSQYNQDLLAVISGQTSVLAVAQQWLDYDFPELLTWLSRHVSTLISYALTSDSDKPTQLEASWKNLLKKSDAKLLFLLLDRVNKLHQKISQGANPNRQLALEALLFETCDKFQGKH
jgi:DNA polymerase-3 subunit delta'